MVKMQVFDLLSAITVYSELGYTLAVDALKSYRVMNYLFFLYGVCTLLTSFV